MSDSTPSSPPSPRPVFAEDHCKGCLRCVEACPRKVLRVKAGLNKRGVHAVEYVGAGCTGCAICYYNCPEPYAIEIHTPDKAEA